MKSWTQVLAVTILAMGLGACSKKSNKSVATTPTTPIAGNSCLNGNYVLDPSTGQYRDVTTGQIVNCQNPGIGNGTGWIPGGGYNNGQYGYGCDYWNQIYGHGMYVPVHMNGQLTCLRYDLLSSYGVPNYGGGYGGGYGQQYYTCHWGYNCNSGGYYGGYAPYPGYTGGSGGCVNFGGSGYGNSSSISGNIGICW